MTMPYCDTWGLFWALLGASRGPSARRGCLWAACRPFFGPSGGPFWAFVGPVFDADFSFQKFGNCQIVYFVGPVFRSDYLG